MLWRWMVAFGALTPCGLTIPDYVAPTIAILLNTLNSEQRHRLAYERSRIDVESSQLSIAPSLSSFEALVHQLCPPGSDALDGEYILLSYSNNVEFEL